MIVGPAVLSSLFSMPSCAPISRRILYGIVQQESAGNSNAVHDDTDRRSYFPRDIAGAADLVVRLAQARHAFSVGLMQIETSNWPRYHVSGVQLLNPYVNVAVGCAIYRENLVALRAYNTGTVAASGAGDRYAEAVFHAGRVPVAYLPPATAAPVVALKPTGKRALVRSRSAKPLVFGFSKPDRSISLGSTDGAHNQ